ncbi:alpha/beta fold hydrolase [Erythrobacter sp. AP23]|uniref:alpha/beta fold hydrolase n=1 Tax=Erythrobacter sp. AP23 TaxID=499656 RepID=UPI00076CAD0C|nr:alpha/beta fold hydrolase [Erythrobacter sp. AP23]KWV94043.1 hypothetical protein ASS64_09290 [Erythrobacter sp. AP23]
MSNIKSGDVDVAGVRVHYDEVGEGEPVLFLHGGGPGAHGMSNFVRNMEFFGEHYRAITLDFPSYGASEKVRIDSPVWGYYGKVVGDFIDAMNLGKAHLVGNSLGGAASLMLALREPAKVNKLVLMGCAGGYGVLGPAPTEGIKALLAFYEPPGPSREKLRAFSEALVYDPSHVTDELIEGRFKVASDPESVEYMPIRLRDGKPPVMEEIWRERLDTVTHETLMIWGRDDRVNPVEQGLVLARQMPNARLLVYPKCGHWAQWERADEFNRDVLAFLSDSQG